jgi:hypothetical protein
MCGEVLKVEGRELRYFGDFQKQYCVRVARLVLAIEAESGSLEIAAQFQLKAVAHPPCA